MIAELTKILAVHTTRDYSDFPLGRMFSQDDAVFPSRLDLARVYEKYADIHGLVYHPAQIRSSMVTNCQRHEK